MRTLTERPDDALVEAMADAILECGPDAGPRERSVAALAVARPEIERRLLESMETLPKRIDMQAMSAMEAWERGDISFQKAWEQMIQPRAAFRRERGI